MAGEFIPGTLSWDAVSGGTVAADGESITAAGAEIRTPWINAGTLARIRWALSSGTFTSVQIRSSVTAPDDRGDLCPIQPADSEWAYQYSAAIGDNPETQGWSRSRTITRSTPAAGKLRIQTTGGYYIINPSSAINSTADLTVIRWGVTPNAGHTGDFQVMYDDGSRRFEVSLTGSAYGANANKIRTSTGYISTVATVSGRAYDLEMVIRRSGGTITDHRLFWRERGSSTRTDLTGFVDLGVFGPVAVGTTVILFGDVLGAGCDVTIDHIGVYSGPEWVSVSTGDTSFVDACQRGEVQVRGQLNGTLLSLDLANSLTAPADLTVGADGSADSVIRALASAPAPGNVLYWERTGPSTSDTEYHHQRAYAWPDCENGLHTISVRQATRSGVLSVNAATDTVTLPATAPSVAVTISDSSIAAGETAAASAVLSGGATATLNGDAWDGSETTVVTGIAADYAPPTTPATPVAYRAPSPPSPSWSVDVSNLILSQPPAAGTGQLSVTTIWLGYQPTPGAAAVKLTTAAGFTSGQVAASSVAVGSVTWASGTGIVTAWADLVAAIRDLFPSALICQGNDDGQVVTWSGGINPEAQADYECTVTGKVDEQWYSAARPKYVESRLTDVATKGDQAYLTREYKGVIGSGGAWSISGLPRGETVEFTFPDGSWVERVIPDAATATFSSLSAPS